MKHRLWLMAGIPGSGKSTWIKEHINWFSDSCKVISRDEIRFSMLEENDEYFSKEKEVWNEFIKQTKESLEMNVDTILDATHISAASRCKVLFALNFDTDMSDIEINVIYVNVTLETAKYQNSLRKGLKKVPNSVVEDMFSKTYLPIIEEGFDNIYIYDRTDINKPKYEIIKREK